MTPVSDMTTQVVLSIDRVKIHTFEFGVTANKCFVHFVIILILFHLFFWQCRFCQQMAKYLPGLFCQQAARQA